jgi:hypothetical protein
MTLMIMIKYDFICPPEADNNPRHLRSIKLLS